MMYSVTCFAFCKCKNIKYSYQKVEPAFYSHQKYVQTNIKCSRFECSHCNLFHAMCKKYITYWVSNDKRKKVFCVTDGAQRKPWIVSIYNIDYWSNVRRDTLKWLFFCVCLGTLSRSVTQHDQKPLDRVNIHHFKPNKLKVSEIFFWKRDLSLQRPASVVIAPGWMKCFSWFMR